MKWRNSIIYLIVLLLLGGYYYFEVVRKEHKKADERQARKIFHFAATDVNALQIESKDKKRVRLIKHGEWKITEPISCDVDQSSLEGLLNTLVALEMERNITAKPQELKSFGLANPALKITIQQRDKSAELLLGDKNPAGEAYYATVVEQGNVFMLSEGVWGVLNKGLDELRRRELFTFEPRDIVGMRVMWEDQHEVRVERQGDQEKWSSPDHPDVNIKSVKVENVLDQLRWLRAQKFVENEVTNLAENRLDPPQVTVQLRLEKDRSAQLILGRKSDEGKEISAVSSEIPAVVLVAADILRELPATLETLQDRSIISLKTADITDVKWHLNGEQGHVARMEENAWGWSTDGDRPKELQDSWQVSSLLYDLAEAEYLKEIDPATHVPSQPHGRLEFYANDRKLASIIWDKPLQENSESTNIWVEQEEKLVRPVEVESELMRRTEEDLAKLLQSKS